MFLSIITINYNNLEGLQRTIDSVLSQTFSDYEWIVIDGGSNDGSKEMIEQYADHFAYWCSEPDKGIYNAMNKGIAHAKGDYLQFLNSGDWLHEDTTLERVFNSHQNTEIIYGDVVYVDTKNNNPVRFEKKPDNVSLFYFYHNTLCQQATFYRKSVFKKHQFDESFRICSDIAFFIQLLFDGCQMTHIPITIVNFSEGGIGAIMNQEHINERENMYKKYVPWFLQQNMEDLLKYDKDNNYYNSHKSFSIILNFAKWIIHKVDVVVSFIEKHRISRKKQ